MLCIHSFSLFYNKTECTEMCLFICPLMGICVISSFRYLQQCFYEHSFPSGTYATLPLWCMPVPLGNWWIQIMEIFPLTKKMSNSSPFNKKSQYFKFGVNFCQSKEYLKAFQWDLWVPKIWLESKKVLFSIENRCWSTDWVAPLLDYRPIQGKVASFTPGQGT